MLLKSSVLLMSFSFVLHCQVPVISPGGVVNSASYTTFPDIQNLNGNGVGFGVAGGSIVPIFGTNLALSTQQAQTLPLPLELGQTVVTVNGVSAPIFYVSPGLINFQMPSPWLQSNRQSGPGNIIVSTPAGVSKSYLIDGVDAFGVFTQDSSGCGAGVVQNFRPDGSVSLNTPANSATPGDFFVIYGTGMGIVYNSPPDGSPLAPGALTIRGENPTPAFDFADKPPVFNVLTYWAGRAPGLVGVDQINFPVLDTIREGCAVPMQIQTDDGSSQPVTVAIRNGGGPCVDPPSAGFGQISWEKTVTTVPILGGAGRRHDCN